MPIDQPSTVLAIALRDAFNQPANANINWLLRELEKALDGLSISLQLQVAGNILAQLAEIYAARAEQLLDSWEERHRPVSFEPILTQEMLQEVLRQTMSINLEELLEEHDASPRVLRPVESVVSEVPKDNLLEFIHTVEREEEKQRAFAIAHDENVSAWSQTISQWMQLHKTPKIPLLELQRSLQMPLINLWLAVLLGGYGIEQRGDFYQIDTIWVSDIP